MCVCGVGWGGGDKKGLVLLKAGTHHKAWEGCGSAFAV